MKKATSKIISLQELKALLAPLFTTHRKRLIFGFTALITVDLLQLTIPRLIKRGVDGLSGLTIGQGELLQLGCTILGIAFLVVILRFCWRYLIIGFSRLLERAIRNRLFGHILKMDAQFFAKHTTGDLMAHLGNDLSSVQMACGMGLVAAADALVTSVAAIGFMIAIDPVLTLLALLPMPFLAISTRILSGKLHKRFATVQEQFSTMTEFSRSILLSIGLIKAYTMETFQKIYRPEIYNANSTAGQVYQPSLKYQDYSLTQIVYDREERSQMAVKQGKFTEAQFIQPYQAILEEWAASYDVHERAVEECADKEYAA